MEISYMMVQSIFQCLYIVFFQKVCSNIARHTDSIIKNAIGKRKGNIYNLRANQLPDSDYNKHRYATQQHFTGYAQTGDIILFRDNHTMAKIQRFLNNSECDHIGVIFKDQKYGLCIFQSNSGTGVSLALWNQLICYNWFENIEGIFWRRLNMQNMQNRPKDFDHKIREFVKVNLHKQTAYPLESCYPSMKLFTKVQPRRRIGPIFVLNWLPLFTGISDCQTQGNPPALICLKILSIKAILI